MDRALDQTPMKISVTEAKAHLTDLVRRAEAGEDVILTRHGQPAARLTPIRTALDPQARRRVLEAARDRGRAAATPGPTAARSQDFLYDGDGLPR
jgi:prevent-host-death family protein